MASFSSSFPPQSTVIVVGGGAPPPGALAGRLPAADEVICADRGYSHAVALGLRPTTLVGDLDSLAPADVAHAHAAGIEVQRYRPEKDETDLELALDRATRDRTEPTLVVVVATPDLSERVDHFLSQLGLLASPKYAHVTLQAWFGEAFVAIVHPGAPVTVDGSLGALVSLIPVGGDAIGVTTDGLQYPLVDEDLSPFSTRGISNVATASPAHVGIRRGVLGIVIPHALRGTP